MVWFKVDDGWHKHRKRIRTGMDLEGFAARGLWADAGSWSSDEGTDGWIPLDMLDYIAPGIGRKLADRLTRSGLWHPLEERDGEEGYQFHDFDTYNPPAAAVELSIAKSSESGKRGNHDRWHARRGLTDPNCSYCSPAKSRRNSAGSGTRSGTRSDPRSGGESGSRSGSRSGGESPVPSRPDPTLISSKPVVVQDVEPLPRQDHKEDSEPNPATTDEITESNWSRKLRGLPPVKQSNGLAAARKAVAERKARGGG